jgi:hypothetical protein
LGFVGVAAILAAKFRAAYAKSHSKLAALREVLQQVQDGTLLTPEPQPEQADEGEQQQQEQQGEDQDEATAAAGGDHYGEVVLELKDLQEHQQQQEQSTQQQHCLLDFE